MEISLAARIITCAKSNNTLRIIAPAAIRTSRGQQLWCMNHAFVSSAGKGIDLLDPFLGEKWSLQRCLSQISLSPLHRHALTVVFRAPLDSSGVLHSNAVFHLQACGHSTLFGVCYSQVYIYYRARSYLDTAWCC